jgi:hypothetical protein
MYSPKTRITIFLTAVITLGTLLIGWTNTGGEPKAADIKKAVGKSLPLLQKSGHLFIQRSAAHCTSCHNNLLTGMMEEKMMQKGLPVVDSFRAERIMITNLGLRFVTNPNDPNNFVFAKFIPSYALIALHADHAEPNPYTDIAVDYILNQQRPNGSFQGEGGRPPHGTGDAHLEALCIRAMQCYTPPTKKTQVDQAVALAKQWLLQYQPNTQQELAFQLLGLHWAGATTAEKEKFAARLKAIQNADGSWSQLPTMHGDAYATGEALYALLETGMALPQEENVQKTVAWLLKTQDPTGAWIVEARAYPIQPFLNCDFPPYDENQFISAAATNWACLALLETLPDNSSQVTPRN